MNAARAAEALITRDDAPRGAVVGISRGGANDIAAAGVANSSGRPLTSETLFDLASVTKVAGTTSALHRLAARGELSFDDPVSRYLDTSPCTPDTTVRTLLRHRAGLWEWQPLYFTAEPAGAIDELPLRYPAHTARRYSDLGYMLLGRIVSVAAGLPLEEAVRELVHVPLGMTRTGYRPDPAEDVAASSHGEAAERRMVRTGEPYPILFADPGFAWREHELVGEANDGNCHHAFGGVSGHAGLFSTAADLLALGASLATAEHHEFWGTEVSADVFRDGPDTGQALGWRSLPVQIDGRLERMLWHGGYVGTGLGFIPGREIAVVMLTNRLFADPVPAVDDLWATTLAALPEFSPSTVTEDHA